MLVSCAGPTASFRMGGMTAREAFPGIDGELAQATVEGNTAEMERLVKRGANPNAKGAEGSTPLMWAVGSHSHRGLEKLLELGADPNGRIPVRGTSLPPTWVAARGNDSETLKILLEHGGDPNAAHACETVLMAAVGSLEPSRIDLVLTHGGDIDGEACEFGAPEVAAVLGRFDIVLYLFSKGYNNKLERLAKVASITHVSEQSQQYANKLKLLALLRERGITIPPPRR